MGPQAFWGSGENGRMAIYCQGFFKISSASTGLTPSPSYPLESSKCNAFHTNMLIYIVLKRKQWELSLVVV